MVDVAVYWTREPVVAACATADDPKVRYEIVLELRDE